MKVLREPSFLHFKHYEKEERVERGNKIWGERSVHACLSEKVAIVSWDGVGQQLNLGYPWASMKHQIKSTR